MQRAVRVVAVLLGIAAALLMVFGTTWPLWQSIPAALVAGPALGFLFDRAWRGR